MYREGRGSWLSDWVKQGQGFNLPDRSGVVESKSKLRLMLLNVGMIILLTRTLMSYQ